MTFADIALRNAARGFRVIPVKPGEKRPFLMDWPNLASADGGQIRAWAAQWPDCNCGVAGGTDVIILDTDRLDRLQEVCGASWKEWSNTYSVGRGDPNRLHLYYRATEEVLAFGNRKWKEDGNDGNVFELKGTGAQVVAEGSVHASGGVYTITRDVPLIPFPPALFHLLKDWWSKQNPSGKREWNLPVHDGEGRDDFLIAQAGKLRNVGASEATIRAHLDDLNSDPAVMADPKSEEDLDRIAKSAARYDVPAPAPQVRIGTASTPQPEVAPLPERKRPTYPIEVWDGTAAGEFAKICAEDNNIPRKIYVESFRCCLGAVVGDRISCPEAEGALPRSYTIIIAPKGKGKGTGIRRAVRFFTQTWKSAFTTLTPGLLFGDRNSIWKPKGVGAWLAAASSVPGMARLTKELKGTPVERSWGGTLPRVLSVYEEMKGFLSTLFIEGGVGSGMEGIVCQLWDDVTFNGTATGNREALYGEMMFSLLAGVTETDWFDILSRGNAVGGGLMSRFNLIGTEGAYENVSKMNQPNFTALQETFLPRLRLLEDAHAVIRSTEGADEVISNWQDTLPEGSERMNVHAWRSALLLAWLRHEDAITAKAAEDAVLLGQYQVDSHDYYNVKAADSANAKVQGKILRALEMKGPMSKRALQQCTHAHRAGTLVWTTALNGLVQDGLAGKRDDGTYYLAKQ